MSPLLLLPLLLLLFRLLLLFFFLDYEHNSMDGFMKRRMTMGAILTHKHHSRRLNFIFFGVFRTQWNRIDCFYHGETRVALAKVIDEDGLGERRKGTQKGRAEPLLPFHSARNGVGYRLKGKKGGRGDSKL